MNRFLDSLNSNDLLGLKIIASLVCFVLIIIVILLAFSHNNQMSIDRVTLCPVDEQRRPHHVFIIDTTDQLAGFQAKYLLTHVNRVIDDGGIGDRFTAYGVDANLGGLSKVEFDMCKPHDGQDMNEIYENPVLAKRKFETRFLEPFSTYLSQLENVPSQPRSPLVESISDIFKLGVFNRHDSERIIYMYSDFLQSSRRGSIYKGRIDNLNLECSVSEEVDLISLHFLERPDVKNLQSTKVVKQWVEVLEKCTRKLSFKRVRA